MDKLSGDYIAGFVDGEGCFALNFRRDVRHERKNKPVYFSWKLQFSIVLRQDDREILERIRTTLECGSISIAKRGQARYQVADISELNYKISPFFEKYSLQAKKKLDFVLWKEAVAIIFKSMRKDINVQPGTYGFTKTQWDSKDLSRLKQIHEEMTAYKSKTRPWKWL